MWSWSLPAGSTAERRGGPSLADPTECDRDGVSAAGNRDRRSVGRAFSCPWPGLLEVRELRAGIPWGSSGHGHDTAREDFDRRA